MQSRFFLTKKLEPIHFLQAMRSSNSFFPFFSISLAMVAFSLVSLQNVFRLIASGVNKWLLHGYFRRICFVHTRRPRTAWRTSHKANEFSRATLSATCENHVTKLHKPIIFACHNLACKRPPSARTCATLGYFQTVCLRASSRQTESG